MADIDELIKVKTQALQRMRAALLNRDRADDDVNRAWRMHQAALGRRAKAEVEFAEARRHLEALAAEPRPKG